MRRAVLATTGISALVVALLALKPHQLPALAAAAPRSPTTSHTPAGTSPGTPTGTGTFTGDPIDTQYGTVQVAATLSQGRITSIKVLQAPDRRGRDQEIAAYALPRLTQEAIGAQSAHIDAVSGASYTSQGYIQSLQSALDQAHA
ncbi:MULTISPECIES: FMN-binding protein [Streptomyces]|uniref:FMN-binding protein n=1 Tax=Streptomyces TaxID=1883 RepID=UPI00017F0D4A|nr:MULTISPECIES: FMN-binding protein [Streptomyces]AKL70594.1 FMN-binding protein [Streptomyces sp. Mg1]WBY24410.1 FMN-binding protein [Streptomyces goshikiensis]WSS03865.1 FMN-binding protein [Streptomyces goshikiensis]WSY02975.1 FMN-binding protein [Streptomyces goshikiensis]